MMYLLSYIGKDSKTEAVPPCPVSLVPEEKVSFSLYALSVSALTVAKIRKAYNKLDSKAIAKQVNQLPGTEDNKMKDYTCTF